MRATAGAMTKKHWAILAAAAAAGLLFRVWVLVSPVGQLDADEAVVGLMAKHILQGDFPTFFWGQPYGGTIEAFLTAPFFGVFGPHKLTIEIVPILLDVAAAALVWRIARRVVDEWAALLAAALFWVWPAYSLWKSTKAHGFYAAALVLMLSAVLLAFRLYRRVEWRNVLALGLVVGAGWWTTPQTVIFSFPLLVWLLVSKTEIYRKIHLLAGGAIVGALPWIVYSLANGWRSTLAGSTTPGLEDARNHLVGIFRNGWPAILGLRVPWSQEWIPTPWVGRVLYAIVIAAFAWVFVRVMFRDPERNPLSQPLVLILAMFPFVLSMSNQGFYTAEPRYFYLLTPVVALLAVIAVRRWTFGRSVVAVAIAVVVSGVGLGFMADREVTSVTVPEVRLPPDVGPAIELLEEHDVRHVSTHYWIAYLVTFFTDEEIIASPDTGTVRNAEWAAEVAADPEAAHVYVMGSGAEAPYVQQLRDGSVPYERYEAAEFVVYIPHPR